MGQAKAAGGRLAMHSLIDEHGCRKMRKSKDVPVTLLAALAMFTTGCHDTPETRNCVDAQGRMVSDTRCEDAGLNSTYHYVYGGSSGGHWGDSVVGGSTTSGHGAGFFSGGGSGSHSSGVTSGGFGHAGGGAGGGE
jgi:hypothetical protein